LEDIFWVRKMNRGDNMRWGEYTKKIGVECQEEVGGEGGARPWKRRDK